MAYTLSNMLPLGTLAPDFRLPDTVSGKILSLAEVKSDRAMVIFFSCNHCPYVHFVNDEVVRIAEEYKAKGVAFVAISVNDVARYPEDSPEKMTEFAAASGYNFPYLYDETQEVGKAYDAACTPDFYVFDGQMRLAYRGRIDDARPTNGKPVTGADLRATLDAVLKGEAVSEVQYPAEAAALNGSKVMEVK